MATLADVSQAPRAAVSVRYPVEPRLREWELPEEASVPESPVHDNAAEHLVLLLKAWAKGLDEDVAIARNLAVRWLEHAPQVGVDPDVCVLYPPPRDTIVSLRLWLPGHHPPPLCFEIVSCNHPYKDYADVHERYAALGTRELVVFDPSLVGPKSLGGPVSLQLWRRDALGALDRVYFGPGPVYCELLNGWLFAEEQRLIICSDRAGRQRWQTGEERERAEKERERAEKERERAEKERERAARLELERRVSELERGR